MRLEVQSNLRVYGILEGLIESLLQRRRRNSKDCGPVDDLEDVRCHKSFELLHGERRVLIEERVYIQQAPEEVVWDLLQMSFRPGRFFYRADQVDIIDALLPGNVVDACCLVHQRRNDDLTKVRGI